LTNLEEKPLVKDDYELNYVRHNAIKQVTKDYDNFEFNTAVARMMELVNALTKYENAGIANEKLYRDSVIDLVKMLAPLAPHMCEEFWEMLGNKFSIFGEKWCEFDEKALVKPEIELVIQVNSKIRDRMNFDSSLSASEIEQIVRSNEKIIELLGGKPIKKVIVIPSRLVNIIA